MISAAALALAVTFHPAFTALQAEWSHVRDYTVTIEAHEKLAGRGYNDLIKYAFRRPDRARMEIASGAQRGDVALWSGGDRVAAYHRGLAFVKLRYGAQDPAVTSPRGNGILVPNFAATIACFDAHAQSISERPGMPIDGDATTAVTLTRTGFSCPEDSTLDRAEITTDVIYVSDRTHLPMFRERYAGSVRVESWKLRDLRINVGLTDRDLR